jgi:hypothetical protein
MRCPCVVAVLATQDGDIFKSTDPQALENSYALIHRIHEFSSATPIYDAHYAYITP